LKENAPSGVYILPSIADGHLQARENNSSSPHFHGIIFLKRGMYKSGIFKFKIILPKHYNSANQWPHIIMTTRVYHPLVNLETGELNIRALIPNWDPKKHVLTTLAMLIKSTFLVPESNFDKIHIWNQEAKILLDIDERAYGKMVENCVEESKRNIKVGMCKGQRDNNPWQFQGCQRRHNNLLNELKSKANQGNVTLKSTEILDMVAEATLRSGVFESN